MVELSLQRHELGRTDLEVTPICFGTSALGDTPSSYGYRVDEDLAVSTLRQIFEGPVNCVDTSRNYGEGRSEERIGRVLRELGGLPDGFVVSTKIDADGETRRFDGDQARRSIEGSAEALGLDEFQLVHMHDPEKARSLDEVTGRGGALEALFEMKASGLIQAVGLAAGRVDVMVPLLREWPFDVLLTHNRFTLANRNAEPMIDLAVEKGVAVINAAPYNGGVFAKGVTSFPRYAYQRMPQAEQELIRSIESVCREHGVPTGAAALQFSLRDDRVASTLCGITRPERIRQTLEWARFPIPEALWAALDALPFSTEDPEKNRRRRPTSTS